MSNFSCIIFNCFSTVSIDYLSNIQVSIDGTVLAGPADEGVIAKRKSLHEDELAVLRKKTLRIDNLSRQINNLDSITSSENVIGLFFHQSVLCTN